MAETMTELEIIQSERVNSGSSWTRNTQFDKYGFIEVKNLWDPDELYHPVPAERGSMHYYGSRLDQVKYNPQESQVEGSFSRYNHPQYKKIHSGIRKKLEKIIGRELCNTYYYDRFYFSGQALQKHTDRCACEISLTLHISTNLPEPERNWPIWMKACDVYADESKSQVMIPGEPKSVILSPGDGLIYKGCERPHWRDPMPTPRRRKRDILLRREQPEYYYHQMFFHYILADGQRAYAAWDMSRG